MTRKRTPEEYAQLMNDLGNGEYRLAEGEVYLNNKAKLKTVHLNCGCITEIAPRDFIKGQRCFSCSKEERIWSRRKEKHQEFASYLKTETNGEYEISQNEVFINSKTPINLLHHKCGNLYSVRVDDFKKNGSRCPKCKVHSNSKSHEKFLEDMKDSCGGEYSVIEGEKYINTRTPIAIQHIPCGNIYTIRPSNFLRGQARCTACKVKEENNPEKIAQFLKRVNELSGNEYTPLDVSRLLNNKSRVLMKHNLCDNEYEVEVNQFLQGSRCPKCAIEARSNQYRKRKTHKEFVQEVLEQGNGEYHVLPGETYYNNNTHIKLIHTTCGHIYSVTPSNFLKGRRCPECMNRMKSQKLRKTHPEFVQEVYELVGHEYNVLSTYINSETKVMIRHEPCSHVWNVAPTSFLKGTRCPSCAISANANRQRKTHETFVSELYSLVEDEYTVKPGQKYINNNTSIVMIHHVCGHEYRVRPSNFLYGRRCPLCVKDSKGDATRKSVETLKEEILMYGEEEYEMTPESIYTNTDTPIQLKHLTCGYIWDVKPSSFLRGARCPSCNGGIRMSHEEFVGIVEVQGQGSYSLAEGEIYRNNHTHIQLVHIECGTHYKVTPANFKSGKRCPRCAFTGMSRGEKEITEYLESHAISFEQQKSFSDCKFKRRLRFDFAIYQANELRALIEYNGMQHYEAVDYFGGEKALKINQMRDRIKRKYCQRKNIPLIEIRYDEDAIDTLERELVKVGFAVKSRSSLSS